MPLFLTQAQIYNLLQRELPEDVYPDGPPSAFFSTAENDSVAKVLGSAYENAEKIYNNFFPQSADEKIGEWEVKVYGKQLDSTFTLQQRRDRVLAKIRSSEGLSIADMKYVVHQIIDAGIDVEIAEWGEHTGTWSIGLSQLGVETAFGMDVNRYAYVGADLDEKSAAELGLTEQELLDYREGAYTYEVRIYNHTLTVKERADLDAALLYSEPAKAHHVITDGLTDADKLDGTT